MHCTEQQMYLTVSQFVLPIMDLGSSVHSVRCKEQSSVPLVKISFCIMNLDVYELRCKDKT